MNSQPLSVYYETKLPYYIVTALLVIGFFVGFILIGGDYLMNICFYFLCISVVFFLFVCVYSGSKFYIYEDKLVWRKGFHKIESPWNEVVGIHYDYRRNYSPFRMKEGLFVKSSDFFIETKKGYTKYASELNIRKDKYTLGSKSKELIAEIKQRSGAKEDVGAISAFKQRQNLWGIIILIGAILLLGIGGIWYGNYQSQQEINSIPNVTLSP